MECRAADAPAFRRWAWPSRRKAGFHRPARWLAPRFQRCRGMGRGLRLLSEPWMTQGAEAERSGQTKALRKSLPQPELSLRPWTVPAWFETSRSHCNRNFQFRLVFGTGYASSALDTINPPSDQASREIVEF